MAELRRFYRQGKKISCVPFGISHGAGTAARTTQKRHHLNYLQDPDNLSILKNLAKRFFGDDVAVQITAADPGSSGRRTETTAAGSASQGDEGNPMVKEALRIFGGSIKTVRRENG